MGFQKLCILTAKSSSRVIIINELKDGTKTPDPIGLHVFYSYNKCGSRRTVSNNMTRAVGPLTSCNLT